MKSFKPEGPFPPKADQPLAGRKSEGATRLPTGSLVGAPIMDKLYFKIGEVAHLAGVEPYVLRYWETEFREIAPIKSRSGQRLYRRKDIDKVLAVKRLLYHDRFTIKGARLKLREMGRMGRVPTVTQLPIGFASEQQDDLLPNRLVRVKEELEGALKILEG